MMKKNTLTLLSLSGIVLVFTSLLSGCAEKHDVTQNIEEQLTGTWQVEEILAFPVIDQSSAHFIFSDENKLTGSASCNNISTSYALDSNKKTLSFQAVAATRKMCEPALMDQETKFLSALEKVSHVEIQQNILYLYNEHNEAVFSASKTDSK